MDKARQFRQAADEHNRDRPKNRWRYPDPLRRLALEHWARRENASLACVARELGVGPSSLIRWRHQAKADEPSPLRPVVIEEAPTFDQPSLPPEPASTLSLTTPDGLRIEGLTLPQVVELAGVLR